MKKKHIFIICSIICAIAIIALVLVFTIKPEQSDDNSNNNPPEQQQTQEEPMFVVPEIINLYLSDTNVEVSANVVFSKNYEIIYFAENTEIIELNGGVICPKQIGSTKVFTKLVYDDKQITKQTQVNVFEDVKSVECKIYKQDEIISQLFIGEKYIVKLQINSPIIGDFSFYANNNISNLILENKNDFEYCYEFSALQSGIAEFCFKFKDFENNFVYNIYSYIKNIDVYVDDNLYTQNKINLYLFNNQYKQQANEDGVFDCVKFEAKVANGCVANCLDFLFENEVVEYKNGYIYANSIGDCIIKIKATDGSNVETNIEICVQNIEPVEIIASDIYANVGEIKQVDFSVMPIYAIYQSEINCQNKNVVIDQNYISANSSGSYEIVINANNIFKTINFIVEAKSQIVIEFQPDIIEMFEIEHQLNQIKLKFIQGSILYFSYYFVDDKNEVLSNVFEIEVVSENNQTNLMYEHENLRFIITVEQKINFVINFYDGNEIYYQLFFEFY